MPLRSRPGRGGKNLRVFTAGGDGTFNEALTGIYGYANAAVGCLPFGSGNDFFCAPLVQRKSFWIWMPSWPVGR